MIKSPKTIGDMLANREEACMIDALKTACASAEYLGIWDKPPQSTWYYAAKTYLSKIESEL